MRTSPTNPVARIVKLSAALALAVGSLVLASCNSTPAPKDTRAADEAAIRAASKAWSDAAQAKDVDKAVSFYATDGIQLTDKGPLVDDAATLHAGWQKMLALPGPGLSLQTSKVEVAKSGDIAYEYGAYDFAVADSAGKITDQKGKYVVIWKKQTDGTWKAAVDINNTDAPTPPAPAPAAKPAAHNSAKRRKHH
jgi:ketosteroid isomerase-like protein